MFQGRRVAVVVPAHDEAERLPEVLGTMPAFVDRVVVVDDGSTDGTARIAEAEAAAAPAAIQVIRHAKNLGVGAAIRTGYEAALADSADIVCVMAGDGQMAPGDLWRLVAPIAAGQADYVKGDRSRHPSVRRSMPLVRRLGSAGLARLTALISGYGALRDAQCGYTAASARALAKIPLDRLWPRYGYPNDLLVMLGAAGCTLAQRTVEPVYRGERSGLVPALALFTHSYVLARAAAWRLVAPRSEREAPLAATGEAAMDRAS